MTRSREEFRQRTKQFALRVIRLFNSLPRDEAARTIGRQLLRSGTSVGANYRAACRGRSGAEFCSKLGVVEEEADETAFWMELLIESEVVPEKRLRPLLDEANEIVAMTVSSIKSARVASNKKSPPKRTRKR